MEHACFAGDSAWRAGNAFDVLQNTGDAHLNNKETYTAILQGLVAGLTVSAVLGIAAYIAYAKIQPSLATAETDVSAAASSPLAAFLSKL